MAGSPTEFGVGSGQYISGIKELRRALKRMDPEANKALTVELRKAADPLLQDAKRRVRRDIKNPSRSSGKAAGSLRITAGGAKVKIAAGKKAVPYYGWLDFGGSLRPTGRRKNYQYRPIVGKYGRYLYPAVFKGQARTKRHVEKAIRDAIKRAGLE